MQANAEMSSARDVPGLAIRRVELQFSPSFLNLRFETTRAEGYRIHSMRLCLYTCGTSLRENCFIVHSPSNCNCRSKIANIRA